MPLLRTDTRKQKKALLYIIYKLSFSIWLTKLTHHLATLGLRPRKVQTRRYLLEGRCLTVVSYNVLIDVLLPFSQMSTCNNNFLSKNFNVPNATRQQMRIRTKRVKTQNNFQALHETLYHGSRSQKHGAE